ncbi:2-dehydropantoate 2-reductase [Anaerobacillus alkaliphilus]|uniref:2-dehydropantoate 2-reductase n=1 Tax=Anaerobacillus alkaliphilus TaxID=1548597 RepID=A0A4V1LG08_9BACI|nr:2-dehydropantoate 2-reductase [Anaerobacillus alkaliphilus]RXI98114.1 2-dehydropantoate 2-reductase [Anaerobacillus alkaliphilus]
MRKIGIIGGGSIGLLLAGYLSKANYEVTIYTNTEKQAKSLSTEKLILHNQQGTTAYTVNSIPFDQADYYTDDCLFVAVKQYHLKTLVPKLKDLPGSIRTMVFLQNGMGHLKYLNELTSKSENIYVGIVEHGALKKSDFVVTHTGIGELKIGSYRERQAKSSAIWENLTKVGFRTKHYSDWLQIMERKLVVNGVINPLTALYRVKNGELVRNPYFQKIMRQLFDEIAHVIDCNENDWEQILQICENTSENHSSMLRDIEEGRETEIEAITGVLLDKGNNQEMTLPLNKFIFNCVKGIELRERGGTK